MRSFAVTSGVPVAAWAEQQVASVRDDPAGWATLMEGCHYGPFGQAPRHLPFRRAAMWFMRWQIERGVLQPRCRERPGGPWCAVNERILRDGCDAVGLSGTFGAQASLVPSTNWMSLGRRCDRQAEFRRCRSEPQVVDDEGRYALSHGAGAGQVECIQGA